MDDSGRSLRKQLKERRTGVGKAALRVEARDVGGRSWNCSEEGEEVNVKGGQHKSNRWLNVSRFKTSKVGGSDDKESACKAGNPGSIPGLGRPPEEGNPLQYSCLENPMDRGAWRAIVHGVCKELDMSERLTLSFSKVLTWVATQVSANRRTNFPGCGVRNSLEWDRQNKIISLLGDAFHLDKPFKIMSCNSSYQQILFYILG